jgi:hypothetical protein
MRTRIRASFIFAGFIVCILGPQSSFGGTFGSDLSSSWADTPKGRFECRDDASTDFQQVLTLGSTRIYQQQSSPEGPGGPTLSDGIQDENTGCPDIVANRNGYLVIVRAVQPPHYGVSGYAVINFNNPKLPVIELAQGQDPRDSKIKDANRLKWDDKGLTLQFIGYLANEQTSTTSTPPPKPHRVRFNFSNETVEVVK